MEFSRYILTRRIPMPMEGWTSIWTVPDNICVDNSALLNSGTCGFNSIWTLGSDKRPICTCPKGYSLLDPNDPYSSCKPDFIQGCEEAKLSPRNDLYYFEVITNIQWINSENYALLKPYTEDQCSKSCWEDSVLSPFLKRMVAVTKRSNLFLMGEWTKALWAQRLIWK